jgi:hypothetical protein
MECPRTVISIIFCFCTRFDVHDHINCLANNEMQRMLPTGLHINTSLSKIMLSKRILLYGCNHKTFHSTPKKKANMQYCGPFGSKLCMLDQIMLESRQSDRVCFLMEEIP